MPSLRPGRRLLQMRYAPINPSDLIPIHGQYAHRIALPQVHGYEGVGVIVDPQSGRSTGRRALAVAGDGSWQTFVTLPEERVVWVPDDIDDASAAQIYINPLTCWVLLTQWLPLSAGDVLLLNGGGSAVSLLLAQLTALRGIRLAVVVRNLAHRPALLAAGARRVIEALQLAQMTHFGARAAIDCIGGEDGLQLARAVRTGGDFVALGLLGGRRGLAARGRRIEAARFAVPLAQMECAGSTGAVANGVLSAIPAAATRPAGFAPTRRDLSFASVRSGAAARSPTRRKRQNIPYADGIGDDCGGLTITQRGSQ